VGLQHWLVTVWDTRPCPLSPLRRGRRLGRQKSTMTLAPIRREILVSPLPDRAFALFTSHIGRWWPLRDFSVSGARGPRGSTPRARKSPARAR
jgi:hypothetical protein